MLKKLNRIYNNYKLDVLFVLLITIVFSIPLFTSGLNVGHDTLFHMNRIVGTWEGFLDHQFPVKIYPNTNNGFGYASPLFYCDYFLYPFAVLYGLGVPLVITYKLLLITFFLITSLTCLYTSKTLFKEKRTTPYIVSILYIFFSYHIITTYVRAALGEIFASAFVPLVLLAMYKILKEHKDSWMLLGISFTLLLFSHMLSFSLYCVLFAVFIIYFIIINRKNKGIIFTALISIGKAIILAVGLSAIFLFPFAEQVFSQKFNFMFPRGYEASSINAFFKPFISKELYYEHFSNVVHGGITAILIVLLSLLFDKDDLSRFIVIIVVFISLIITNIINIEKLGYAHTLQFGFRLYLLTFPLASYLGGRLFDKVIVKKYLLYFLSVLICLYSFLNMYLMNNVLINNVDYIDNYSSAEEIYDVKDIINVQTANTKQIMGREYLQSEVVTNFLTDSLSIKKYLNEYEWFDYICTDDYQKQGTRFEFYLVADEEMVLMLPQTYYKGYQVYLTDGDWIKIDTYTLPFYYETTFKTVIGAHRYTSIYKGTVIQKASILISGISFLVLIVKKAQRNNSFTQKNKKTDTKQS